MAVAALVVSLVSIASAAVAPLAPHDEVCGAPVFLAIAVCAAASVVAVTLAGTALGSRPGRAFAIVALVLGLVGFLGALLGLMACSLNGLPHFG
jgi:hypothetical protein